MVSPTTDRRLGLVGNTPLKAPVTVATTVAITLSGEQTIDGVAVVASNSAGVPDRVLVKDQASAVYNGIYDVSTGAWTRSKDANGNYDLARGTLVNVTRGTVNGNALFELSTADPITIDTTGQTWAQSLTASLLPLNDAQVSVQREETNAVERTLHFYIQKSRLLMANYCDPTVDTPTQVATALANAIADAKAFDKALVFDALAVYETNAETAFLGANGIRGLRLWGQQATIYRSSGAGPVVSFDAGGSTGERCDDHEFVDFVLRGNAASTYGFFSRGQLRSKIHNVRVKDVVDAGFMIQWAVLNDYRNLFVSDNIDSFVVNPQKGIIIDRPAVGYESTANVFTNLIMEGPIVNVGIDLTFGNVNVFKGGSCEAIARGVVIRADSGWNTFIGVDFEANSVYDAEVLGSRNLFQQCIMSSTGSSGTALIQSGAKNNKWEGGYLREVAIDAAAEASSFDNVSLSDDGAEGFQGAGTDYLTRNCVLISAASAITARVSNRQGPVGTFTATLTGCTTSPTGTVDYRQDGDVVTLNIPAITATSNTTAATLTGMPAAIRPAATRSDIGVVTDNSANSLGRFEIDSGGTITLRVNAGTAFTNVNTKGVQASTISYKL